MRELALDLVTQANAQFGIAKPGTDTIVADVLRRKVQLEARLQDQVLRNSLVVITFGARQHIALVGQEQGARDLVKRRDASFTIYRDNAGAGAP